jgi:catechol 2,3-dioxygenase-like lactoylglutathione lyase family enzyme
MTEFHEIEHVQVAMPSGGEDRARTFYVDVLGFREIAKPDGLRASAGVWFAAGRIEIHVRAEDPTHPSRAAHPGIRVTGLAELAARCEAAGHRPQFDARYPGRRRFYVADPFGNRLEFFEATSAHIGR